MYEKLYDEYSNYVGRAFKTVDKNGNFCVEFYDENDKYLGKSYETTDWKGKKYVVHRDANNNTIAHSELMRDIWGDYYFNTTGNPYVESKMAELYGSNTSDEGGLLWTLLGLVFEFVIMAIAWYFMYLYLAYAASMTWLGWGMLILSISFLPLLTFAYAFVALITFCTFIPYYIMVLKQKRKKRFSWRMVWHFFVRWFFKGPFAYKEIKELRDNPDYDIPYKWYK